MRRELIVAGVSVIAILSLAGVLGYLILTQAPGKVTISDVCGGQLYATFQYDGNASGFLRNYYETPPAVCETDTVAAGSSLNLTLFVHSSDGRDPHQLVSVIANLPFTLISLSPGAPQTISPGGNVSFAALVAVPSSPGTYDSPTATIIVD